MDIPYMYAAMVAFLVVAGTVLLLIVLLVVAVVRKDNGLAYRALGGAALTIGVAMAGYLAFALWWWSPVIRDAKTEAELSKAYETEFADPVPAGVTVLKARSAGVDDSGKQWLLLRMGPEQLEAKMAQGFAKVEHGSSEFYHPGRNAPKWWQPPVRELEYYEYHKWLTTGDPTQREATMGVDRKAGLIWLASSRAN